MHADEASDPCWVLPPCQIARSPPYESQRNYGLMAAGLGMFGGIYATNATAAFALDDKRLAIPIAGPVLSAAGHDRFIATFLVVDSLMQVGGVVMTLIGALTHRRVEAR